MGSINRYPFGSGHRWRVQYRDPDGRKRQKRGFKTKAAASAWLSETATDMDKGRWVRPDAGLSTVGEVGELWLGMQTHLKPSTQALYRQVWVSVNRDWGHVPVGEVSHLGVQQWVAQMDKSASWVRHCHNLLAQVLGMAVAGKMIATNPAVGVKLPKKQLTVRVYWTVEQLGAFARECGEREDLILLLGTSGLRWGEAVALRPRDLDPIRGRIHITRNVVRVDGVGMVFGSPKTHESRSVAVAGFIMDKLLARAGHVGPDDLLWRGVRGGVLKAPGHNSWFSGAMDRAMKADATLQRISPHGLRHVAAGLLVQSGASVKAVQRQLGHASAAMTLDRYADLFEDGLDGVAGALDGFFGAKMEPRAPGQGA